MKEAGIEADVIEDGTTFEENAMIKAKEMHGTEMPEYAMQWFWQMIPAWKLII